MKDWLQVKASRLLHSRSPTGPCIGDLSACTLFPNLFPPRTTHRYPDIHDQPTSVPIAIQFRMSIEHAYAAGLRTTRSNQAAVSAPARRACRCHVSLPLQAGSIGRGLTSRARLFMMHSKRERPSCLYEVVVNAWCTAVPAPRAPQNNPRSD